MLHDALTDIQIKITFSGKYIHPGYKPIGRVDTYLFGCNGHIPGMTLQPRQSSKVLVLEYIFCCMDVLDIYIYTYIYCYTRTMHQYLNIYVVSGGSLFVDTHLHELVLQNGSKITMEWTNIYKV